MKNKSPITLRIISLILLIGWMGLIFYLSHQNASESSNLSTGLIKHIIECFLPDLGSDSANNIILSLQFIVRKTAHFSLYGILGFLAFMNFISYDSLKLSVRCILSFAVSVFYSASDEYHQTFIAGRSGELRDVLIDSSGALFGILASLVIYKTYKSIKNRRSHKMKKKQYIELTDNLSRRLNLEKKRSFELSEENSALNKELLKLKERIIALESKSTPAIDENVVNNSKTVEEIKKEPEFSENINGGAKIIGKIVLSSAEYCNRLTGAAVCENAKELVNLILGRTEIAKAEILRISSLDISSEERISAMEKELNDANDYFKSVMAQKS